MEVITLKSSKNYTNQVALGIGNMRVEGTTVYFTINETGEEVSVTLPAPADGKDGVSVVNVTMDAEHQLFFVLSDGSQIAAGKGILTNALPKPIGVINCQVAPYNNSTIPQGVFILDENGSFIVDKNLKSGERYLYNFSYPIA